MPNGFTIVELLVVITIIVILLALLAPGLDRAVEAAERVRCASNMHAQHAAIALYALAYKKFIPPVRDPGTQAQPTNHWPRWFRDVDPNNTQTVWYWNLGFLWKTGQLRDNGQAYFCPSQKNPGLTYATYSASGFPTDTGSPPLSAVGVRSAYYYNPTCISAADRTRRHRKLADLHGDILLVFDSIEGVASIAHGAEGWNRLFGDGSARYAENRWVAENIPRIDFGNAGYDFYDQVIESLAKD
jgi:prepilin-type N-terminal cleavage/methylation domain-containing protein